MKAVPTVPSDSRKLLPPFEYTAPATSGASKFSFLGVAYNRCILAALNLTSRFRRFRGTLRAAIIAALVAGVGWFMPLLIGSGDVLTQTVLDGRLLIGALAFGFVLHFFLGPASYATRTPGGLFAPMLAVGAQAGTLFFILWVRFLPFLNATPRHCAIIGIAAFFASVVRAPSLALSLLSNLPEASFSFCRCSSPVSLLLP